MCISLIECKNFLFTTLCENGFKEVVAVELDVVAFCDLTGAWLQDDSWFSIWFKRRPMSLSIVLRELVSVEVCVLLLVALRQKRVPFCWEDTSMAQIKMDYCVNPSENMKT